LNVCALKKEEVGGKKKRGLYSLFRFGEEKKKKKKGKGAGVSLSFGEREDGSGGGGRRNNPFSIVAGRVEGHKKGGGGNGGTSNLRPILIGEDRKKKGGKGKDSRSALTWKEWKSGKKIVEGGKGERKKRRSTPIKSFVQTGKGRKNKEGGGAGNLSPTGRENTNLEKKGGEEADKSPTFLRKKEEKRRGMKKKKNLTSLFGRQGARKKKARNNLTLA